MRSLARLGVLLGLTAAAISLVLLKSNGLRRASGESRPAEADSSAVATEILCLHSGTIDKGESLFEELVASGVSPAETDRVVKALGSVIDLKRLRPGEKFSALTDESGRVRSFSYVRGFRERVELRREEGGLRCRLVSLPLEQRIVCLRGEIRSSLWESMVGKGISPEMAVKLADVFAWEIDFLTEPRDGDTFELIAEEYCDGDSVVEYGEILAARYRGKHKTSTAVRYVTADGRSGYYTPEGKSVKRAFLKSPLNYRRISSYYTRRRFHPILKRFRPHLGVDYAAARGTPVVAIGDGVVVRAGWNGGFGKYVEIRHNSVYSSCYGHLSRFGRGIRKGARVHQNQVIGYVGATGLATGPHLDFRIKKYGRYVNPLRLKSPRAEPVPPREMDRFRLVAEWALWALDYLPSGYSADSAELRGLMLAEAGAAGKGVQ